MTFNVALIVALNQFLDIKAVFLSISNLYFEGRLIIIDQVCPPPNITLIYLCNLLRVLRLCHDDNF